MAAFVLPCSSFAGVRPRARRLACRRRRAFAPAPRASIAESAAVLPSTLVVAENLYGTIFLGGLGIIASGVVGAFIVSLLARRSFDDLERDFIYRDMTDEERAEFESQDVILKAENITEEEKRANPFISSKNEDEEASRKNEVEEAASDSRR